MVRRSLSAALVGWALAACGSGDDAGSIAVRCLTINDRYDQPHCLCCKQPDEVARTSLDCGQHVAIGCEGKLYCTFYTDDDKVTNECMSAATCGQCESVGDTGLEVWCHDHLLGD